MAAREDQPTYLCVSEVIQLLQFALDQTVPQLTFVAEISDITKAASGHYYLTLKDEKAQVSAVMWKGSVRTLTFAPERGVLVHCVGKPAIYAANGRLQVVLSHMAPAGEGVLQRKFLEMRARLEKEGLFQEDRKRALPFLPKAIGIVTSKTGAVIHDMMVKLRERMPQVPVYLMDVRVQGEGAALEIAAAIDYLSQADLVDVIIVARGGGSLEDLWAFNEEIVVRSIFAARVPVVSGVGHEVDFTLADFAADVRAPTPTAAAEMVVPLRSELIRRIEDLQRRLSNTDRWFQPLVQRLDELDASFSKRLSARLEHLSMSLNARAALLEKIRPLVLIERYQSRLALVEQRLRAGLVRQIDLRKAKLENQSARFEGLSPLRVLERGFAIVENRGKVVRDADEIAADEIIDVRVHRGSLRARVV